MKKEYIIKSERLGFRNWSNCDLQAFAALNADPDVMRHFPKPLSESETQGFIQRLQQHYELRGYNYFATEILDTGEFIGFIGLACQDYASEFTPATDIGWRLKKSAWGKGYATEGAKRCLEYAFDVLKINRVIATCPLKNMNSENVMKKIGMIKKGEFMHPRLKDYPELERCIWYELVSEQDRTAVRHLG